MFNLLTLHFFGLVLLLTGVSMTTIVAYRQFRRQQISRLQSFLSRDKPCAGHRSEKIFLLLGKFFIFIGIVITIRTYWQSPQ